MHKRVWGPASVCPDCTFIFVTGGKDRPPSPSPSRPAFITQRSRILILLACGPRARACDKSLDLQKEPCVSRARRELEMKGEAPERRARRPVARQARKSAIRFFSLGAGRAGAGRELLLEVAGAAFHPSAYTRQSETYRILLRAKTSTYRAEDRVPQINEPSKSTMTRDGKIYCICR